MVVGTVVSLWRYPVKSMMGEELNASEVTERGLLGDRTCALMDSATGMVVSAKHPRKWKQLYDCRATDVRPTCSIVIPRDPKHRIRSPDASPTEIQSKVPSWI